MTLGRGTSADERSKDIDVSSQPSGLAQVYVEIRSDLLRFLTARLGSRETAEDILQELWIRLEMASTGPVANSRAYLYRAAQNLALDAVRSRQRQALRDNEWAKGQGIAGSLYPADPRPHAEAEMLAREDAAALASAIAALPDGAGRALRLHKLEGLSHAEVATRLGVSRSAVEKRLAVAMAHLRSALRTEG